LTRPAISAGERETAAALTPRPRTRSELAEHARTKLIETPCGVYYHYTVSGPDDFFQEAETLVLPICKGNSKTPSSTISVRNVLRKHGDVDPSRLLKLDKLQLDYVDIGAGIPQE
jgi:hypothetical protein